MPAAIDLLSTVTRPDGLRASPEMAVVASAPTNRNKANLETVRILNIRPPPLNFDETIHKCIELVYWSLVQYEKESGLLSETVESFAFLLPSIRRKEPYRLKRQAEDSHRNVQKFGADVGRR